MQVFYHFSDSGSLNSSQGWIEGRRCLFPTGKMIPDFFSWDLGVSSLRAQINGKTNLWRCVCFFWIESNSLSCPVKRRSFRKNQDSIPDLVRIRRSQKSFCKRLGRCSAVLCTFIPEGLISALKNVAMGPPVLTRRGRYKDGELTLSLEITTRS